jgi:hypothetical protein
MSINFPTGLPATTTIEKTDHGLKADTGTGLSKRVEYRKVRTHVSSIEATSSAEQTWTTQYGLRVDHADCEITPTATADEWPVGEVRHVISPSERFQILVPNGHSLNDEVDGESPWFGGPADVKSATQTVSLLRVSATLWVWWATARSRTQRVTELDANIEEDVDAVAIDTADAGDLTFPEIVKGKQIRIYTQALGGTITLRPLSEDNYVNGSSSFNIVRSAYIPIRCYVFTAVVFGGVLQWSSGDIEGFLVSSLLPTIDSIYTSVGNLETWRTTAEGQISDLETNLGATAAELSTTIGRVGSLEAPLSSNASSSSVSWTIEKRLRNVYTTGLATFTPPTSTTDWPVGEARPLANFSTAAHGIRLNVPSGHYLNGVLNGNSGTLGAAAAAAGSPIFTILVTREDTDRWSWA